MIVQRLLSRSNSNDKIQFTINATSSSKQIVLNNFTAPKNAVVDWGDNSTDVINSSTTSLTHTYTSTGNKIITISGSLGGFWNSTTAATGATLVTAVNEINSNYLTTLANTFRGCTSLTTVPSSIIASSLTNCSYAFYNCKSITSAFPYLWNSHSSATHTSCFTNSYKTLYGYYGSSSKCTSYGDVSNYTRYGKTNCPKYDSSVTSSSGKTVTYYQQYGKTSCPKYNSSSGTTTYYQQYGGYSSCPKYTSSTSSSASTLWYDTKGTSCSYYINDARHLVWTDKNDVDNDDNCSDAMCGAKVSLVANPLPIPGSYYIDWNIQFNNLSEARAYAAHSRSNCPYGSAGSSTTTYQCSYYNAACKGSSCGVAYSTTYQCSYYNAACKGSSCAAKYTTKHQCSALSGLCKGSSCTITSKLCKKSNTSCKTSSCPYAYANQTSVTAAKNAGWA